MRLLIALIALLAAPLATAAPAPSLYYLADSESPLGQGVLSADAPSKNESSMRLVIPSAEPMVWFAAGEAEQARIYGPAFVGLWTHANIVGQGNLSAALWLIDGDEETLLASKSLSVAIDPASLPDPASLVPPDPTDPEGAAYHLASKLLPIITDPPLVYELGMIDAIVPANASVRLSFALENGDQPAAGASALSYDAVTSPSFLYMPWYAPDPPKPTATSTSSSTSSPSSAPPSSSGSPGMSGTSGPSSQPAASDAPGEDSPGIGLIAGVALLGVAWAVRRRL